MLLFIIPSHSISLSSSMFQYISCYSLSGRSLSDVIPVFVSIHLMLLFIRASTTSLTGLSAVSIHLMLLFIQRHPEVGEAQQAFQYISCYSLSKPHYFPNREMMCFNTSHVTLYPQEKRSRAFGENSFNTSHVTLYRHILEEIIFFRVVSIHLMLLFIEIQSQGPCGPRNVSIHLMLLFI